jgi:hypothetical protein
MKPLTRIRLPAAAPWRACLVLWLTCALLLAPAQAAQHALAMALGADICSAADQPGANTSASSHDCCDAGLSALPPPSLPAVLGWLPSPPPQAAPRTAHLPVAAWASPPARAPPASGTSLLPPH